jgi:DNA-binding PadR family transcriptional regulator
MGKIEQEAQKIHRRTNIQKIILRTIATAGVLSLAMLAPNALQLLVVTEKGSGKRRRMNPTYLIDSAFEKLCSRGLILIEVGQHGKVVRLTDDGKRMLARMVARSPDKRKHHPWDKRWRMVIYDIKEKRRGTRILLQRTLRAFGFYQLQNSVWVYPYDCEDLLILLKADFKIGLDVLYGVAEKVEGDEKIKEYFGLK